MTELHAERWSIEVAPATSGIYRLVSRQRQFRWPCLRLGVSGAFEIDNVFHWPIWHDAIAAGDGE